MLSIDKIKSLDLEISSYCIASCPMCPRNFYGMKHNAGYPVTNVTMADFQNVFPSSFVSQIEYVKFNGNFGDFNMNPDSGQILNYLRAHSPDVVLEVHTNGSSRNTEFWSELAQSDPVIFFDIDGLEDTHHLHRIGTSFEKILQNAEAFINAGGRAVWKMIVFDHNRHQIQQCRDRARDLGFVDFCTVNDGRNDAYVFDPAGNFMHVIGRPGYPPVPHASTLMNWKKEHNRNKKDYSKKPKNNIDCLAKKNNRIYMSSNGDIYPCCWLGFSPLTYDEELHSGNDQLKVLMKNVKNNAITHGLETAIEWFNLIEESWKKDSFQSGKLYRCDLYCGKN